MMWNNKKQQNNCLPLGQTYISNINLNKNSKKWTNIQEASGLYTAPNVARTISCKAWNSPVEYPSKECKHDIKESEGNMLNPIFKENVQGRKHPGSCAFTEPELLSYRKPKYVLQKVKNLPWNPNHIHNCHDENHDEIEYYQGNMNT